MKMIKQRRMVMFPMESKPFPECRVDAYAEEPKMTEYEKIALVMLVVGGLIAAEAVAILVLLVSR